MDEVPRSQVDIMARACLEAVVSAEHREATTTPPCCGRAPNVRGFAFDLTDTVPAGLPRGHRPHALPVVRDNRLRNASPCPGAQVGQQASLGHGAVPCAGAK
jgi:hypothetical protein